jgi:hypothetical protein
MSIPFNDTSNLKGLVQLFEREIGADYGFVSGNTTRLKAFTADVNLALDEFTGLAIKSSGTWQYDDSNHTDYPEMTTNLVPGQRDYPFTVDENSNLVLDIYRVFVKVGSQYVEIKPVDKQRDDVSGLYDGLDTQGTPYRYDKTANGIFLDPIPASNVTNGLKVYINRESSYFTTSDTTKKPGVPGTLHRFFYIRPAFDYARINGLSNFQAIQTEYYKLVGNPNDPNDNGEIGAYFAGRTKDEPKRLTAAYQNNR